MNEYSKIWPEGKKCAVMLSVNLDAEFYGRIYYPGINVDEGDIMRLGKTGMEFGLPRLLDTLDNYGVKATFFIPGAVADRYPAQVMEIARRGHEIGCHGDEHEILGALSKEEQKKRFLERIEVPEKNWKFSEADVAERAHWEDYMAAYEAAINATATEHSPWYVLPADRKWQTRWLISQAVRRTLEEADPRYPEVPEDKGLELQRCRGKLLAEE